MKGATGHNTLPPRNLQGRNIELQVRLQRFGLLIWQDVADINAFGNTMVQKNCHSAMRVVTEHVKGSCSFWVHFS